MTHIDFEISGGQKRALRRIIAALLACGLAPGTGAAVAAAAPRLGLDELSHLPAGELPPPRNPGWAGPGAGTAQFGAAAPSTPLPLSAAKEPT